MCIWTKYSTYLSMWDIFVLLYIVVSLPKSMFIIESKCRMYVYWQMHWMYQSVNRSKETKMWSVTFSCPHTIQIYIYIRFSYLYSFLFVPPDNIFACSDNSVNFLAEPCCWKSTIVEYTYQLALKFEPDNDLNYYKIIITLIAACKIIWCYFE